MARTRAVAGLGLALALLLCGRAAASGDGIPAPWYLDPYGGEAKDQAAFVAGRLGVLMTRTDRPRLFMAWRLLHGLPVGAEAGAALSQPCCDGPRWTPDRPAKPDAREAWVQARKAAGGTGQGPEGGLRAERPGVDLTSEPVCFDDAFLKAADTAKDRAGRFGTGSPDVNAWLTAQDAVFLACSDPQAELPALPAGAPRWLRQDHAYQQAALDLYAGRFSHAAAGFATIAKDSDSPWQPWGRYLQARALKQQAVDKPSPEALTAAHGAIEDLAREPGAVLGKDDAKDLSHILDFRYAPAKLLAELDVDLQRPELPKNAAAYFRDYSDLIDHQPARPDLGDWIWTLAARSTDKGADDYRTPVDVQVRLRREALKQALDHARERWSATHDKAWLLAALTLADPGTAGARTLSKDGGKVRPSYPGWLTVQYHLIRLNLADADEAATRRRLDAILARQDLSATDRNLFRGLRTQVASDPHDFVRWALRRRICAQGQYLVETDCGRDAWLPVVQSGDFDQNRNRGSTGLGEDAVALIDRMPLADRIALSKDQSLPSLIRMDIALTSFARAVQLQDDAAVDELAVELEPLLPQMADDFGRIPATKPGPEKRFAVGMIMAKIPGLRVDLVDYVRPSGRVMDFQRHWMDWLVLPPGKSQRGIGPPTLAAYQEQGVMPQGYSWRTRADHANDKLMDMACLGECGPGAQPLHLPAFLRRLQPKAEAERAFFVQRGDTEEGVFNPVTDKLEPVPPGPAAARDLWEEMLAYAKAHPADPRVPEALHWIVHASHFGASHDHSGRRAFRMLQLGYPKSVWAQRTKYWTE
jgi:hypothetical protein